MKNQLLLLEMKQTGVSKNLLELADESIKIPMKGKTESLNAAVATGILLYEMNRRKM